MPEHENIMGTLPVKRLVLTMSWPIMLSMFLQAIYNLWDSICVAQVSDQAFLALSLAWPIQMLMIAFCVGTGVGVNTVLARSLGAKDMDTAHSAACHGFFLFGCTWVLFLLFGLFGTGVFFRLSIDDPVVVADGISYLSICCCGSLGMCIQFITERILQCNGKPMGHMIIQATGALINMVLDPLLIFVFDMGVTGAAVATVIGQWIGGLVGICLVWRLRRQFPIHLRHFRPNAKMLGTIYRIGGPTILMQSMSSFMTLGLNQILIRWSETAVWVLGVYFKVQSFVFMPVFGLNNGMVPIISYNYGARSRERIMQTIRFGVTLGLVIMCTGTLLLWIFPAPLLQYAFNASPEALDMGVFALRIISCAFPFLALSILSSSLFQSLGYALYPLYLGLIRQGVLLTSALLFMFFCANWVWLSFPIVESLGCLITIFMYRKVYREKITQI